MKLILVRHAKAMDRVKALLKLIADEDRPLTKKGVQKFLSHLKIHHKQFLAVNLFISSDLVRAKETLDLILKSRQIKKPAPTLVMKKIGPNDSPTTLLKWLQVRTEKKIVLVGHEPFISKFLVKANCARPPEKIKKGSIICTEINFSDDDQVSLLVERIIEPLKEN